MNTQLNAPRELSLEEMEMVSGGTFSEGGTRYTCADGTHVANADDCGCSQNNPEGSGSNGAYIPSTTPFSFFGDGSNRVTYLTYSGGGENDLTAQDAQDFGNGLMAAGAIVSRFNPAAGGTIAALGGAIYLAGVVAE